MHEQGVRWVEPPEGSECIKKIHRRLNGNRQNSEGFHEFIAKFYWKKLILINNKGRLMEFWKSLIDL